MYRSENYLNAFVNKHLKLVNIKYSVVQSLSHCYAVRMSVISVLKIKQFSI